jgi:hypothetical protein
LKSDNVNTYQYSKGISRHKECGLSAYLKGSEKRETGSYSERKRRMIRDDKYKEKWNTKRKAAALMMASFSAKFRQA